MALHPGKRDVGLHAAQIASAALAISFRPPCRGSGGMRWAPTRSNRDGHSRAPADASS
jgi:hypothetical protein